MVEILIVNTVEVDGHSVAALAKRLDAAGRTELVVNNFPVELIGGHTVFAGHFHLILRDEGEQHTLALAVAAVTPHPFRDFCLDFKSHRAAVTAAMICFHTALLYQFSWSCVSFAPAHTYRYMAKQAGKYTMTEKVFIYPGEVGNWHFVSVTKAVGIEIKDKYGTLAKGFGSLPVTVTIGKTTWQTSIFPDRYSGSYFLPLKAVVRKKEEIEAGENVTYTIVMHLT